MRALLLALLLSGCGSEELSTKKEPLSRDPADYPLSLAQAQAAIEAHDGAGCLRLDPFVECRGCAPRYRLVPIATNATIDGCGRSTFSAGKLVRTANAPPGETYTWTCLGGPLGGTWSNGTITEVGALTCRD